MNKSALTLLIILAVFATGCTGSAAAATLDASAAAAPASPSVVTLPAATPTATALSPFPVRSTASPNALNTSYEGAASVLVQLAAGTLELDGTAQAVTRDQAVALLPLWQDYLTLEHGTATPVTAASTPRGQADEVVDEIELMMTPTQLKAIADLEVTEDSAKDVLGLVAPTAEVQYMVGEAASMQLVSAVVQYLRETVSG